jgi:hypothetical protein
LVELKAQLKKLREICSEKGFEGKF